MKIQKENRGGGGGVQDRCEIRIEVIVEMQKKYRGSGMSGPVGDGGGRGIRVNR